MEFQDLEQDLRCENYEPPQVKYVVSSVYCLPELLLIPCKGGDRKWISLVTILFGGKAEEL